MQECHLNERRTGAREMSKAEEGRQHGLGVGVATKDRHHYPLLVLRRRTLDVGCWTLDVGDGGSDGAADPRPRAEHGWHSHTPGSPLDTARVPH